MANREEQVAVETLARLRMDLDMQQATGGDSAVYGALAEKFDEDYKRLSTVVSCLKEKLQLEIQRIQGVDVDRSSEENSSRLMERLLILEGRFGDIENRLESIDESLKESLGNIGATKFTGLRTLKLASWRAWSVEDKFLALLYLAPVMVVLLLLCSAVYRILLADTIEIKMELNMAELIGGSLVGLGAALAGGGYALKIYKEIKTE
jgi:hypothetical protein